MSVDVSIVFKDPERPAERRCLTPQRGFHEVWEPVAKTIAPTFMASLGYALVLATREDIEGLIREFAVMRAYFRAQYDQTHDEGMLFFQQRAQGVVEMRAEIAIDDIECVCCS